MTHVLKISANHHLYPLNSQPYIDKKNWHAGQLIIRVKDSLNGPLKNYGFRVKIQNPYQMNTTIYSMPGENEYYTCGKNGFINFGVARFYNNNKTRKRGTILIEAASSIKGSKVYEGQIGYTFRIMGGPPEPYVQSIQFTVEPEYNKTKNRIDGNSIGEIDHGVSIDAEYKASDPIGINTIGVKVGSRMSTNTIKNDIKQYSSPISGLEICQIGFGGNECY